MTNKTLIIAEKDSQGKSLAEAFNCNEKKFTIELPNKISQKLIEKIESSNKKIRIKTKSINKLEIEFKNSMMEKEKEIQKKIDDLELQYDDKDKNINELKSYQKLLERKESIKEKSKPKILLNAINKLSEYIEENNILKKEYEIEKKKLKKNEMIYWENDDIIIVSATGHLLDIKFSGKNDDLNFKTELNPPSPTSSPSKWLKFKLIEHFLMDYELEDIICGTDYDREGSSIFGSLIEYFDIDFDNCSRMKFSTLEPEILIKAFDNREDFDYDRYIAGKCRRWLDFAIGYNLSPSLAIIYRNYVVSYLESIDLGENAINSIKYNNTFNIGRVKLVILEKISDHTIKELQNASNIKNNDIEEGETIEKYNFILIDEQGQSAHLHDIQSDYEYDLEIINQIDFEKDIIVKIKKIQEYDGFVQVEIPTLLNMTKVFQICKDLGATTEEINRTLEYLYLQKYISYPRSKSEKWEINDENDKKTYTNSIIKMLENLSYPVKDYYFESTGNEGTQSHSHPAIHPLPSVTPKMIQTLKITSPLGFLIFNEIAYHTLKCFEKAPLVKVEKFYYDIYQGDIMIQEDGFFDNWIEMIEPNFYNFKGYWSRERIKEPYNLKENQELKVKIEKQVYKEIEIEKNKKEINKLDDFAIVKFLNENDIGTDATRTQLLHELIENQYIFSQNVLFTTYLGNTLNKIAKNYIDFIDIDYTMKIDEMLNDIEEGNLEEDEFMEKMIYDITLANEKLFEYEDEIHEIFNDIPLCSKHNTEMVIKKGKFGKFFLCPYYYSEDEEMKCNENISI